MPQPAPASPAELIDRLHTRHDELLDRLDELHTQVEDALRDALGPAAVSDPA